MPNAVPRIIGFEPLPAQAALQSGAAGQTPWHASGFFGASFLRGTFFQAFRGPAAAILLAVIFALGSAACGHRLVSRAFVPPPPRPRAAIPPQPQIPAFEAAADLGKVCTSCDEGLPELLASITIPIEVLPPPPAPPKKPQVVATPKPTPTPPPVETGPSPRLGQIFTADQLREYNRTLDESLTRVRTVLAVAGGRKLNAQQSEMVGRIRTFMLQAEQARQQDLVTAVSLARRADLLAQDLSASFF